MKSITSWTDLKEYGIGYLTSESCAYGLRLLCDLNLDGVDLLREYFGTNVVGEDPWNSEVNGKPSVASIMLPRELLIPLAKYILFRSGCSLIVADKGGSHIQGYNEEEEANIRNRMSICGPIEGETFYTLRNPRSKHPKVAGRNVHQFSGRTT